MPLPTPEEMGLETSDDTAVSKLPSPEEMGLEVSSDRKPAGGLPSPEDMGLETSDAKAAPPPAMPRATPPSASTPPLLSQSIGAPSKLPSPEEMGLETSDADNSRGTIGQAFDATKRELGYITNWVKDGYDNGLAGEFIEGLSQTAETPLHVMKEVLNASNRISGSSIGGLASLVNKTGIPAAAKLVLPEVAQQLLHLDSLDILEDARKAQAEEAARLGYTPSGFDQVFPVRLMEDMGMPLGTKPMNYLGSIMQKADSKTAREVGEVISGLAPAAGVITGIITAAYADILSFTKIGALTKAGVEADKIGELSNGLAKQFEQGERAMISLRPKLPFVGEVARVETSFGKVGTTVVGWGANVMATAEAAQLPKWSPILKGKPLLSGIRQLMTYTPSAEADALIAELQMGYQGVNYHGKKLMSGVYTKAMQLGIDVDNPEVLSDLNKGFSQPSRYAGKLPKDKIEEYYSFLQGELNKEKDLSRMAGIPVPEKDFGGFSQAEIIQQRSESLKVVEGLKRDLENPMLSDSSAKAMRDEIRRQQEFLSGPIPDVRDFDERYVARDAMPSKRQQYLAAKQVKEAQAADELVNDISGIKVQQGTKKYDSFQRLRDARSREAMNAAIERETGVPDFFHDDPTLAYVEKITQLRVARIEKRFVSQLISKYAVDDVTYAEKLSQARANVALAKARGVIPDGEDLLLSKVRVALKRELTSEDMRALDALPPEVRSKLNIAKRDPKAFNRTDVRGILRIDDPDIVSQLPEQLRRGYTNDGLRAAAELTAGARNKLQSLSSLSPELAGAAHLKLPEYVADRIGEVLSAPRAHEAWAGLLGFQNALKSSMFFTPGFHIRNGIENFVRGQSVGVGMADQVKAGLALWHNKVTPLNGWARYTDEFYGNLKIMGLATPNDLGIQSALSGEYQLEKVRIGKEALKESNAYSNTMSAIKEMGATGKLDAFVQNLKASVSQSKEGLREGLFSPRSPIRDNPLFRYSATINEQMEAVPKFAYFSKLRDEGYDIKRAIMKVNETFLNYGDTRAATRTLSLGLPFANYMVKNAETVLGLMVQNPGAVAMYGPGGSIERALSNWNNLDPERVWKYKELFGASANDHIMMGMQPGHEEIMQEKDLVKKFMYNWLKMDRVDANGKHVNDLEGTHIWMRLPTNMHALSMMDPRAASEMAGPLAKMAFALMGVDPFTGKDIQAPEGAAQWYERRRAAMNVLSQVVVPERGLRQAQGLLSQMWPDYQKNLENLGMSPASVDLLMGDRSDEMRRKIAKFYSQAKTGFFGGTSQLGIDKIIRASAILKNAKRYLNGISDQNALGKRPKSDVNFAVNQVMKKVDKLEEITKIHDEYNRALKNMKAPADPEIEIYDDKPSETSENETPGVSSGQGGN